jgi:hypothetical protein
MPLSKAFSRYDGSFPWALLAEAAGLDNFGSLSYGNLEKPFKISQRQLCMEDKSDIPSNRSVRTRDDASSVGESEDIDEDSILSGQSQSDKESSGGDSDRDGGDVEGGRASAKQRRTSLGSTRAKARTDASTVLSTPVAKHGNMLKAYYSLSSPGPVPTVRLLPPKKIVVPKHLFALFSKAFEERPVWLLPAFIAHTRIAQLPFTIVRHALAEVAYFVPKGAFRSCWIRLGYDPRTDKNSAIYQSFDVAIQREAWPLIALAETGKPAYQLTVPSSEVELSSVTPSIRKRDSLQQHADENEDLEENNEGFEDDPGLGESEVDNADDSRGGSGVTGIWGKLAHLRMGCGGIIITRRTCVQIVDLFATDVPRIIAELQTSFLAQGKSRRDVAPHCLSIINSLQMTTDAAVEAFAQKEVERFAQASAGEVLVVVGPTRSHRLPMVQGSFATSFLQSLVQVDSFVDKAEGWFPRASASLLRGVVQCLCVQLLIPSAATIAEFGKAEVEVKGRSPQIQAKCMEEPNSGLRTYHLDSAEDIQAFLKEIHRKTADTLARRRWVSGRAIDGADRDSDGSDEDDAVAGATKAKKPAQTKVERSKRVSFAPGDKAAAPLDPLDADAQTTDIVTGLAPGAHEFDEEEAALCASVALPTSPYDIAADNGLGGDSHGLTVNFDGSFSVSL